MAKAESEVGDPQVGDIVRQDETRCRMLGVDANGWTHVHDPDRDRIVVISKRGIDQQFDLGELDQDLADWMRFVGMRRGWWKPQWVGHQAQEIFGGDGR